MSIKRKLLIFTTLLVITPMIILLISSQHVINGEVEYAAQDYLKNALKIARNQMISREQEVEKACKAIVKAQGNSEYVKQEDIDEINKIIQDFKGTYDYLDFIIVIGSDNRILFSIPEIKSIDFPQLNRLVEEVRLNHNAVVSEESFELCKLFQVNSEDYNKYLIKIPNDNEENEENKYFTKCLSLVCVSPFYNEENSNQQIGFLIAGEIANNDSYFPQTYSKSVKNSFLSISIDDIRITSNIRSPNRADYIGSLAPISMNSLEGSKDVYYGRVSIDNEIHVFLDEPILDYTGNVIGVLGVGIPEHKFSIIMNANRSIIIIVTIFCLICMLFIGRYTAEVITRPIIVATELAGQVAKGENNIIIDDEYLKDEKSETTILLKSFLKMADDLKKSEKRSKEYLKEIQFEHIQQQKLSNQLKILNEELEEKVKSRTQDLHQAIIVLKKADEVKSRFLANMSHELRTPLNAIISCSDILKEEIFGTLNEKQHKYIQNILKSSKLLLQLINDILDISKIQAGKMTLTLGYYSILDIVEESFSTVKSLAYRKNIEVSINITPHDFKIKVDAQKLKQMFYNLLSNAIKFTPDNGEVVVDVFKDDKYMQISVKDNGIGIKEEDHKRVFREFEQVDSSYERNYEGTGLGLPLTKKLVEMHGGSIYLTSKIDEGTEVIITLPINIDDDSIESTLSDD